MKNKMQVCHNRNEKARPLNITSIIITVSCSSLFCRESWYLKYYILICFVICLYYTSDSTCWFTIPYISCPFHFWHTVSEEVPFVTQSIYIFLSALFWTVVIPITELIAGKLRISDTWFSTGLSNALNLKIGWGLRFPISH